MPRDERRNQPGKEIEGALSKFEPGGELGPIEDRNEYETRINRLPPEEKELAAESARFADLCHYFSQQNIDLPPQLVDEVGRVSKLAGRDRIDAMKRLNQALMEYLHDVGQDPQIRQ
jgi:hypothetical protein